MRILVVNKFGYARGGLERVMFDEIQWLREAGHDVEFFATRDCRNEPSRFAASFPRAHDYGPDARPTYGAIRDMFWNRAAADAMSSVLDEFSPDLVHCHGIYRQLSPSILKVAERSRVPVVLTAHDSFLVCPAKTLLHSDRRPCYPRRCGRQTFLPAVMGRCVQGSFLRSGLGAAELTFQRVLKHYEGRLNTLICPSRFMGTVLADGGIGGPRLAVLPNAVAETTDGPRSRNGPFVVAGRLCREKGVAIALEAAQLEGLPIVVAGDGPLAEELRILHPEARLIGHLDRDELMALLRQATALVFPSVCLENAPMSILEAMASGVPVIASRIGGIPEQVTHNRDGLLVPPGDPVALGRAMTRLWDKPLLAASLGHEARATVRQRFAPSSHVEGLLQIYRIALGRRESP